MIKHIYATFLDPAMAERAGGALLDHGVLSENISIVFPLGHAKPGVGQPEQFTENLAKSGITTTTPGDALRGSETGAGIGLVAGALAALAVIFLPGVGLVVGGGALAIALGGVAGATAAGAIAGGMTGYLKDQGVPIEHAEEFQHIIIGGGAMITVSPQDEAVGTLEIESVLEKYDGVIAIYPAPTSTIGVIEADEEKRVGALRW